MSPEPGAEPTLVVIAGRRSGQRLAVPAGETTIGRDAASELVFDDEGVSRHHAMLVPAAHTVTIEDVGSTNGTWVNGEAVSSARELRPGDRIQLGTALLEVAGAPTGAPTAPAGPQSAAAPASRGRVGRVRIGRVILVGGLANLLLVAAGVVIQFATDWTGIGTWIAAPLTGMAASMVALLKDALTRPPETEPVPPPAGPASAGAPGSRGAPGPHRTTAPTGIVQPRRRGVSVLVGVLVVVLVVGVVGVGVTYAVATVSGFVTGNQVGVDRLANGPVAVDSSGVVTTVERVEHTADFTRVELTVRNGLGNTITLPLYGNTTLSAEDGTTLDADAFRSSWSDTIPPGQLRRGTIVFNGHLPDAGTTATLSFATVFEQGFTGPQSIAVPGLSIAPLER